MLILVLLGYCSLRVTLAGDHERRLREFLKDGYEKMVRPGTVNQAVDVSLGLDLQQVMDVDEKNQLMQANVWLKLTWKDTRLQWDPTDFGGIQSVRVPPDDIWRPDLLLFNSVGDSPDSNYKVNAIIEPNGGVSWIPPSIVTSTCDIDITWFPFDEQHCGLRYGSWSYSADLVNMKVGEITTTTYTKNSEWELTNVKGAVHSFKHKGESEPYLDVLFVISLRRKPLYYGFNLIIPCLLISLMVLLDFILPVASGEKLTLGITLFMSLTVFLLMIANKLPPTSDAVALIGVYFSTVLIIVSLSQVFTVLMLNFHFRGPETHAMSPLIRKIFLEWIPWVLMMERPGYEFYRNAAVKRKDSKESDNAECQTAQGGFPRSAFQDQGGDGLRHRLIEGNNNVVSADRSAQAFTWNSSDELEKELSRLEQVFGRVLTELSSIARRIRNKDMIEDNMDDWKFAAMALDRLCMVVFTVFLSVSTCMVIFAAPNAILAF